MPTRFARSELLLVSMLALTLITTAAAEDSPLVAAAKRAQQKVIVGPLLSTLPEIRTVRWFNSKRTDLREFRGQVVLIDFWATWCGPCVAANPGLQTLARSLRTQGFALVLMHSRLTRSPGRDPIDTPAEEVLPEFIAKHEIVVPVAIAAQNEFETLGIRGVPQYVLIDRKGRIRYNRAGVPPRESEIRTLLAESE